MIKNSYSALQQTQAALSKSQLQNKRIPALNKAFEVFSIKATCIKIAEKTLRPILNLKNTDLLFSIIKFESNRLNLCEICQVIKSHAWRLEVTYILNK